MNNRESIRVDFTAIETRIRKYSKKKSRTSQFVASQLSQIASCLIGDGRGYWHRPIVSPFHTKTGRDQPLGASLNQIPKDYWPRLLSPPNGSTYVLLDYQQQEPMIAAYLAGCQVLIDWYASDDIYLQLAKAIGEGLTREQCKKLLIGRLYGKGRQTIAHELQRPMAQVQKWLGVMSDVTRPIDSYLDQEASDIRIKKVAHSLDWRHAVSDMDSPLSLRNWRIQATGADIMRRACTNLDDCNIPVLLTNHDSFLVRLEQHQLPNQLERATQALTDAAVAVLNGFPLKVKVEMKLTSTNK
ncbi:hypothetical protein KY46_21405 [Photobacterium halotolerans]|uniref:DNA-directed DNA polymerase family A palm domain-containing protein n=1 Tax=Photobacterium halotolerans TaxID=265726 RepID=A0A0F5V6Z8_9GAMM|nr:hypothetical protein KY46_21405 [Photobacterium halotolerans]